MEKFIAKSFPKIKALISKAKETIDAVKK